MTPIEDRLVWSIHRAAALSIRARGGHFFCAQAAGFRAAFKATAKQGETFDEALGWPCDQCRRLADNTRSET